jgi:hypothetical protein
MGRRLKSLLGRSVAPFAPFASAQRGDGYSGPAKKKSSPSFQSRRPGLFICDSPGKVTGGKVTKLQKLEKLQSYKVTKVGKVAKVGAFQKL